MSQEKPNIKIGGWSNGIDGVAEPPTSKKASGWGQEKPPYQYHNWLQYVVALWVDYFFDLNFQTTETFNLNFNNDTTTFQNNGNSVVSTYCESGEIKANCLNGSIKNSRFLTVENCEDFDFLSLNNCSFLGGKITGITFKRGDYLILGSSGGFETSNVEIRNSFSGSVGNATKDISNIEVTNCESFSITGNNAKAENSKSSNIHGDSCSVKNCEGVTIPEGIENSSVENVKDHTETLSNTKTLDNLRLKGKNVHAAENSIAKDLQIYKIGNANQKFFGLGLRTFLENSSSNRMYYYAEGDGEDWRNDSRFGSGSRWVITGGTQGTDGIFSNCVISGNGLTFPFTFLADTVIKDHMLSFWLKTKEIVSLVNDANIAYFGLADFGWEIGQESGTQNFYFKARKNDQKYYLPELKLNVYQMVSVILKDGKWIIYIDGDFVLSCDTGTQSVTAGNNLELKCGYIGSGTSDINCIYSDVCYIEETPDPVTIKRLYCGGIPLDTVARAKIGVYNEVKLLFQNQTSISSGEVTYRGLLDDTFLAIEYPKFYKDENYTFLTNYITAYVLNNLIEL